MSTTWQQLKIVLFCAWFSPSLAILVVRYSLFSSHHHFDFELHGIVLKRNKTYFVHIFFFYSSLVGRTKILYSTGTKHLVLQLYIFELSEKERETERICRHILIAVLHMRIGWFVNFFSSLRSILADLDSKWEEWLVVRPFWLDVLKNVYNQIICRASDWWGKRGMSIGPPYIQISTMHHTLISIFCRIRIDFVVWHLLHIQEQHDWISSMIWYNSNGNYVRMIEEIIHWTLLHISTCCGEKKRLWKDFLTLNGHGIISDARCSLWISIFFHTIFVLFCYPSFSIFFSFDFACLGIDSAIS